MRQSFLPVAVRIRERLERARLDSVSVERFGALDGLFADLCDRVLPARRAERRNAQRPLGSL
ncbi:hypothetical protein C6T61_25405 [Burkholderia multivorans]|nr:hypothetical protein C6T61_25405 [Burkholderia multivorans]